MDRAHCTIFGAKAVELIAEKRFGEMVAFTNNQVTSVPLREAVGRLRTVPKDGGFVMQAASAAELVLRRQQENGLPLLSPATRGVLDGAAAMLARGMALNWREPAKLRGGDGPWIRPERRTSALACRQPPHGNSCRLLREPIGFARTPLAPVPRPASLVRGEAPRQRADGRRRRLGG